MANEVGDMQPGGEDVPERHAAHDGQQVSREELLRVMSYNLRYDNPEDGQNRWANRESAVKWVWDAASADIVGIQEGLPHQVRDMRSWFDNYVMLGTGRDSDFGGEHCAVFYRKRRLQLLEHGDFWLSERPDVPGSQSWGSCCPRIVTWALLRSLDVGADLLFLNTHLDHVSELARHNGATLILEFIDTFQDIRGADGVIVAGDLNDTAQDVVRRFTEGRGYTDALAAVNESGATCHGFSGKGLHRIDYVLASPSFEAIDGRVVTDRPNGVFPSDHFPIYVDLILRRSGQASANKSRPVR